MTTGHTPDVPFDDLDFLAAEYALGLATGDDLARARQLVSTDRDFVALVTFWETRFAALTEELDPVSPRPATKAALLAEVFPAARPTPLWNRIRVWQMAALASLLLLVGVVVTDPLQRQVPAGPLYAAEIVTADGDFRVVAVVDKTTDEVFLTRTAGSAPEGRILQVWAHGEGEPAISVGLWPEGTSIRLPMPATIASVEGILTLGISEEPPGGSLTGSPSGRVFGTVDIPNVVGQSEPRLSTGAHVTNN